MSCVADACNRRKVRCCPTSRIVVCADSRQRRVAGEHWVPPAAGVTTVTFPRTVPPAGGVRTRVILPIRSSDCRVSSRLGSVPLVRSLSRSGQNKVCGSAALITRHRCCSWWRCDARNSVPVIVVVHTCVRRFCSAGEHLRALRTVPLRW